jgi:hypothetical protein
LACLSGRTRYSTSEMRRKIASPFPNPAEA